jgi:hypothetical protein
LWLKVTSLLAVTSSVAFVVAAIVVMAVIIILPVGETSRDQLGVVGSIIVVTLMLPSAVTFAVEPSPIRVVLI